MNQGLKNSMLKAASPLYSPVAKWLSSRRPTVLLYHGVPRASDGVFLDAEAFERHILFLKERFRVLYPHEAIGRRRAASEKPEVVLTFDDGFRNNAEVAAPLLRKHRLPAIFFVSTRHMETGKYLWFSYLIALQEYFPGKSLVFRGKTWDMAKPQRAATVRRLREYLLTLRPHPNAMYDAIANELPRLEDFIDEATLRDRFAGMTPEQVTDLARDELFSLGIHTVDHPFLTQCEPAEAFRQIHENRLRLEELSGETCTTVAYPLGDYNAEILSQCRQLNLTLGFAVIDREQNDPAFEIPRVGVYVNCTRILGLKAFWGNTIRQLNVPVG